MNLRTPILTASLVLAAGPAFAEWRSGWWHGDSHQWPIQVSCDRYQQREIVAVNLNDKEIQVELHGRNETINEIKAEKTWPIYNVIGKVNKTGNGTTPSEIALGNKLPPDDQQNWTVFFGDIQIAVMGLYPAPSGRP